MAIKKLLDLMTNPNIVEDIENTEGGEQELMFIGRRVKEGYGADWDSMSEWRDDVETGMELIKPSKGPRDEPWEGAANFKTPILMEARLKYGDRASQELLKGDDLVKATVVGKDPDDVKADRIERIQTVMNWQLTVQNESWVEEQDKLLYDLSCQGSIFKKTFFNSSVGHNESEVITYPNFAINQSTKTLSSAPRFTHRIFLTPNQIQEKILSGVWRDVEIELGAKVSEEGGREEAVDDKFTEFYEQQTFLDLDGDDYEEPYVVTVHASSGTVMRIRAQYGLDDITVMDDDGLAITADSLIQKNQEGAPIFDENEDILLSDDSESLTVVKIKRDNSITEYGFITDPSGNFLKVGYFHILGSYAAGINTTTNQLLDSGTLANLQGGWLAKGFRKRLGNMKVQPGAWIATDISAQQLQTGVRPFDFKEPSPTLLNLNQNMNAEAQRLSATTDLSAALGPNTPATTALSMLLEQQEAKGAINLRVYRAMGREFAIWFKLNSKFMDPELYGELVDDPEADPVADFNAQDMGIAPSANPENSSKIQRIQQSRAELDVMPQVDATGGNSQAIVKDYLKSIGSESLDEIYPELTPEQAKSQAQEQARLKARQEELEFLPIKAQADVGEAEKAKAQAALIREDTNREKALSDIRLTEAKVIETNASAFLKTEQGETEATKNAGAIVDAELKLEQNQRERDLAALDREKLNEQRPS